MDTGSSDPWTTISDLVKSLETFLDDNIDSDGVVGFEKDIEASILGNHLYTIVNGPSWTHANSNSRRLGGYLASINNEKENQFLNTNLALPGYKDGATDNWFWIGVRGNTDGTITLSSGEDIEYSNWHDGGGPNDPLLPNYLSSIGYSGVLEPYIRTNGKWSALRGTNHSGNTIDVNPNGFDISGLAEIPFIRRGDSAYVIVEGPTWEEAEANANALGGHLVTINDISEYNWLIDTYQGYSNEDATTSWRKNKVYIGFNDRNAEGQWEWVSGETSSWEPNWTPGMPDNGGGKENVAELYLRNTQHWRLFERGWINDVENEQISGIAEIKLASNNRPTGTPTLTGDFEVGKTISIDASPINDADNHEYWTPNYEYSWEVSGNDGRTWTALNQCRCH